MRNANRSIGLIVSCAVLIGASGVFAQDWPQWRGPHRDGKVMGFTAPETWPEAFAQKWKVTVGSGDSTPALVGDKLYVFARQGEDEVTSCLKAADGSEVWQDKYAALATTGPASRHPGPRSSPAVAEGKVVTLGVGGVLSCLDATTGELVWRKDPFPKEVPRFYTAASPLIVDGMGIAHLGGSGHGALLAIELKTGETKWQWAEEGPAYASPVLLTVEGAKQIVTLTEKSLVGVSAADGKLLWQLPFPPEGRTYNAATPIVDGQKVIYTGAGRGTRAAKIEKQEEGFAARELWSNPDLAPQFNTPVLRDGLLFGLSSKGNLFCIDAETGETAWTDATSRDRSGFAAMVDAGAAILALPSNSELIAFKPSKESYQELARIKVSETPTYAHPVVACRAIFVKDENAVTMWSME
ncbi:MAG: PQQ-binding-like beta-propeller repeat protein [Planctomycetota bacterium]